MTTPHRASDAEHAAPPLICHTTQDAIRTARQCVQSPEDEWLCCLALDAVDEMRAAWIIRGETCPFEVQVEAMLREVTCWKPARLITVRHHPHVGPFPLRAELPWVETFYAECAAMGVACSYVAMYADGDVFDVPARGHYWAQAVGSYVPLTLLLAELVLQCP